MTAAPTSAMIIGGGPGMMFAAGVLLILDGIALAAVSRRPEARAKPRG